jgi:glucokinase
MMAIGLDIGGTKILAALVDANGHVVSRQRTPTPTGKGPAAVLSAATDVVIALNASPDIPLGVGAAGTIDPRTGTVRYATDSVPGWAGTPLADELRRRTGRTVVVENDVNAAAIGETWRGAGHDHAAVLLVAAGTGLGGGLVRDGRLERGVRGGAMELAHVYVGSDHPAEDHVARLHGAEHHGAAQDRCGCGRPGHLEAVASGTGIARAYARQCDETVSAAEVARRAEQGDPVAAAVIARAGDVLGRALAGLVAVLDVSVVVLGGGIGPVLFSHAVKAYCSERVAAYADVDLVPTRLGADGVVVGAARLAMEE